FALSFVASGLYAQNPKHLIDFNETTHDFGTVKKGDKTEFTFQFTNTSDAPVTLKNVKASCGCTTPKWTRDPVGPGETGDIHVTYNSNRIGPFNKSVRINYNDRTDPVMVYIKGKVNAPEGTAAVTKPPVKPAVPKINYNVPRGALAFEKIIENMKQITSDDVKVVEFRFKNTSTQTVKFNTAESTADDGLSFSLKDTELKPGQESIVKVTVDGKKMKAANQGDGYFSKRISLMTDEKEGRKQLTVNGSYKRIYSAEEKAAAPKIEFETVSIDGGKIIEGEKFIYDFKFKNLGQGPLKISSAKASCGCTATKPPGESIGAGQESVITATFNSKGRVGRQSKSITVKSNDLENPTVILKFTVEVVKDPFHAGGMMGGSK
ncbi:MAG: DUF1573 domain-containing protein, partial [Bacteroidota bacterium]